MSFRMSSAAVVVSGCLLSVPGVVRGLQLDLESKRHHGLDLLNRVDMKEDPIWRDAMQLLDGPPQSLKDASSRPSADTLERQHEMHGMTQHQKAETIRDMQSFIANSPEGFATLVLFGDSTMSGIVTELFGVDDHLHEEQEIIYVSNDRVKSVRYGCNEECGGVPPGGEWKNETLINDEMTKLTVQRTEASTRALHKSKCNSGGGLETYVFRSGVYKGLVVHHWGFLPEYAKYCWQPCMTEAMAALKPTAVVWNIGLHLLNHDFSPSICEERHNPAQPECGNYHAMVTKATNQMIQGGIQTVVWKHTNFVCEARQIVGFPETKKGLDKWHEESNRASLEEVCREECPQYEGMPCYDWFFDAHTSERMYNASTEALAEVRKFAPESYRILELDTFNPSRECCGRGCEDETEDGEHYAGLDSEFTQHLASMLSGRVQV